MNKDELFLSRFVAGEEVLSINPSLLGGIKNKILNEYQIVGGHTLRSPGFAGGSSSVTAIDVLTKIDVKKNSLTTRVSGVGDIVFYSSGTGEAERLKWESVPAAQEVADFIWRLKSTKPTDPLESTQLQNQGASHAPFKGSLGRKILIFHDRYLDYMGIDCFGPGSSLIGINYEIVKRGQKITKGKLPKPRELFGQDFSTKWLSYYVHAPVSGLCLWVYSHQPWILIPEKEEKPLLQSEVFRDVIEYVSENAGFLSRHHPKLLDWRNSVHEQNECHFISMDFSELADANAALAEIRREKPELWKYVEHLQV